MNNYKITNKDEEEIIIEASGFYVNEFGAHFYKEHRLGELLATFNHYNHIEKIKMTVIKENVPQDKEQIADLAVLMLSNGAHGMGRHTLFSDAVKKAERLIKSRDEFLNNK